ncbi:MAG: hypothetical protein Tsb0016_18860 [Sphingomonadales bacterium]
MSEKMDVLNRLIDCWKRRDVEGYLACMTDDVKYYWHIDSKPAIGKDKIRKFIANYSAAYNQTQWRILNHAENGNLLLVEGHEEIQDLKHDRTIQQPFMQAFEFRDGLIAEMRDYYEPANLKPPAEKQAAGAN